jgi:abortive infection bacteriophage resistance protein
VKYNKLSLTVAEQIKLLKARGMTFADEASAIQKLQHTNYYRLRAYWLPFEDVRHVSVATAEHSFLPNTTFESVLVYYAFDQQLKMLLMDAIERVEISLRTNWAHQLALRYGSHAYLDTSLFTDQQRHKKSLQSLHAEVVRSQETFIKHYRETYTEPELPPIWAICEVMTLGQLSQWFDNLTRRADRQAIAQAFGFDEVVLCAFAHHLATVRNLCAHHSRVWNRSFTIRMKLPNRPATIVQNFNDKQGKKIYNTLVMLALLLDVVNPNSGWKSRLFDLMASMPEGTDQAMGFPEGWSEELAVWLR